MHNKENIYLHTLGNGLKLVHVHRNSPVAWCGLAVNAGSRDEMVGQYGLAHFVEHTIFKGTKRRSSTRINNRMEQVGGELNAYTTKESTMLYCIFPVEHLERAVELIADLVENSVFPEHEIATELDVVLEEVASYRDSPSEAVYDDFEDMLLAGSQLGHNILGEEKDLRRLTSGHCLDWLKRLYVPSNMVFFSLVSTPADRVFRLAEKYFGILSHAKKGLKRKAPATLEPQRKVVDLGLHQSHTIVGARVPGMFDDHRFAFALLNNILGGPGMNSLLNVSLREKRGLVYTVESSLVTFADCGMIQIYLGCEHEKLKKALRLIDNTIDSLAQAPMSDRRLDAYKRQYSGQLLVASDNAEFTAMGAGRGLLYYNRVSTLDDNIDCILSVTPEQLQQAAQQLTLEHCSVLTLK
ncbi:MAG: insulinase family protein [Muribaculaceae bacterium]|nr:insulinase family protein [Muribaculaceae bacterium]